MKIDKPTDEELRKGILSSRVGQIFALILFVVSFLFHADTALILCLVWIAYEKNYGLSCKIRLEIREHDKNITDSIETLFMK